MLRVGVDIGGTFTDLVAYDDERGTVITSKVPTTPSAPEEGCIEVFQVAGVQRSAVDRFIHGTTLVTNLLLERTGGKVGLTTTLGFRDVLEIGRADREEPYDPQWTRPPPLIPRHLRLEVDERMDPTGHVLTPLDPDHAAEVVDRLLDMGVEAVAVALLHAYANPEHELALRDTIRRRAEDIPVSLSSQVSPQIREYERTSTTAANAYSVPKLLNYTNRLGEAFPQLPIWYMTASGKVVPPSTAAEFPYQLCLSGPAGGVLAGVYLAERLGLEDIITMDMGGTSCDVCLVQGGLISSTHAVEVEWGIPIQVDAMAIKTVGAGGGSVGWVDSGGAMRVGPRSSGAVPGPACYGRGGEEPTLTDANLVLGILNPETPLGGQVELDPRLAWRSLEGIAQALGMEAGETIARGMHRIANAGMAQAIREITVQKGIDPRGSTLISFGGAGGQHAAEVARELGIRRVLFPANASVLSAFGMVTADLGVSRSRSIMQPLDERGWTEARRILAELRSEAAQQLQVEPSDVHAEFLAEYRLDLRYRRQSYEISIVVEEGDSVSDIRARFEARHEEIFGTRLSGGLDVVSVRVSLSLPSATPSLIPLEAQADRNPVKGRRRLALEDADVEILDRSRLQPGDRVSGPSVIEERDSTILLPAECGARLDEFGNLWAEIG